MHSVLVLDFGSQYTQLIARRIREIGIYSEIVPYNTPIDEIRQHNPGALILSGGPNSVYGEEALHPDERIFDLGVPVLGICYGLQVIATHFGGEVAVSPKQEFGRAQLLVNRQDGSAESMLFRDIPDSDVWMSHGDKVVKMPEGFRVTASSANSEMCAIEASGSRAALKVYGLQFHPEVQHSLYGKQLLSNFLIDIAGLTPDWSPKSFIEHQLEEIRSTAGDATVICGISGGVDSTVAAVLVSRAIGKNLHCVFVDNGLLRKNEAQKVMDVLRPLGLRITLVDAEETFLRRLKSVASPENKRKIIGRTFIHIFEEQIHEEKFLVQGTLYPDVIESVSVKGPSQTIKSHHNVGGLPKRMKLKLIEPLRELFKDEVRAVGRELGIDEDILMRHPFPGPGLAVRVLGSLTRERLDILRNADEIFLEELKKHGLYQQVWQAFSVLLPVQSVGVMGDKRTYENVLALRAVESSDGMTADWAHLPHDFLSLVSNRIINEVRGINRVAYDISSKPPATIEWE
ncbi:glutamine-hydrolyzing GMP synthase [Prosthecochloris sp. N3]|uniref:GMP synthase [glutamine-hydrolyzing] n=1 Tax=Prosthecochloris ethylica TaxID=2743976 RepID=A0ABR9XRQ7_9CHLB|nr:MULTISPECIES: glutamine-hydrolyzing GMP synthase [Prosthecochloris]MEC9487784.1 glutamine-hydrolyzing GMP synthase [Prosthecochloris sp.]MBF0586920.1 glutamine-hydrolyzing GMP synthase [Prosthecochloris ethylica]MBF0636732.1 glutamine-hydrolyzing GMP synthase [Prosthecochloris ethylica]NUK48408.1 glutamine-hydrolyzing GMP synthase [Prosthecochloris ethylica]RNA64247.1 glutamine-hydrolyzing GMP synthase [Prosthecochloris sp. ZM_2]